MIDRATVQRIKDTANIVEVVGDYVHLVRRGANYMGLCPFHNERTPSFSVSPRRNFCYCFSCHKGGSPVNFIMEKEGLSYHDALLQLAKKYGIKVEERELTDEERAAQTEREGMLVANEWAMKEMERQLHDTEEGRNVGLQYLYSRGVTDEAIRKFHLGYALDRGDAMVIASREAGFDPAVMTSIGVLGMSQKEGQAGMLYDRFRGRVIFPILNPSGKVVAFGGRDLKGAKAKYVNSPESPLYRKSNELYGIHQAKGAIVKQDKCFLVEGYMDVIGMWQSGMENVVASSGTALTDGQIALIHRFTNKITLLYDGDAAGIKASLRGIDMLLSHKMQVKVLLLPDGHDPDSFARQHTPEEFREYVEAHETDIIRFKAKVLMQDVGNDPARRIEAVRSVVESLACIPDKIARNVYTQECSVILGVPESVINDEVIKARARAGIRKAPPLSDPLPPQQGMSGQNQTPAPPSSASGNESPSNTAPTPPPSPLAPLERKICEVAIRYGLLDFCPVDEDPDEEAANHGNNTTDAVHAEEVEMLNVAEFIADELEADSLKLSHPVYARIFDTVLNMRSTLEASRYDWEQRIQQEIDTKRREGQDQIANQNLTMNEIQVQEKILEENLSRFKCDEWRNFVREFPGRELASHEDAEIRTTVTQLLQEPYELSKIFTRDRAPGYETERLELIVPRSVLELKDGIIEMKLKKQMELLRQSSGQSPEKQLEIQRSIAVLMNLRSRLAKDIGERILPASRK